jgi:hypothetical protein
MQGTFGRANSLIDTLKSNKSAAVRYIVPHGLSLADKRSDDDPKPIRAHEL